MSGLGLVWIGDGEEPIHEGISSFTQELYRHEPRDGYFGREGEPIGTANVTVVIEGQTALATITLEFRGRGALVASGTLAFDESKMSIGDGVLDVTARSGFLEHAGDTLRVEADNPKKYTSQ